jgi:hypothetical protein
MSTRCPLAYLLVLLSSVLAFGDEADTPQLSPEIAAYFKRHCYQCHDSQTQKGDRRFDQISSDVAVSEDTISLLEEALDAINRGEMPPPNESVVQPSKQTTRDLVVSLTSFLKQASDSKAPATTVMRRLNRYEYVNTLRDLIGIHPEFFDPTTDFPADALDHGFDNNGEALTLSDYQLQRYLEVAETAIQTVMVFERPKPKQQAWRYTGKDFNGVLSYERAPVTWRLIVNDDYLEIGHGQPSERHVNYVPAFEKKVGGAPADGWYTIKVRAAAANRLDHGYDHDEFERFRDTPLKMALWIATSSNAMATSSNAYSAAAASISIQAAAGTVMLPLTT